jgi:hypothetical protein
MKASELSGEQLDLWVARARGVAVYPGEGGGLRYDPAPGLRAQPWQPSRWWSQGGPLIEQARIDLNWDTEGTGEWAASIEPDVLAHGASVLEAAMRALVMEKFGEQLPQA